MRLRTQVQQALHCCVLMAVSSDGPLSTSFLAETCGLPREYLSKTLQALARGKVISATYGPGGGYHLNRQAGEVSILEIVEAIEGPTDTLRSKARVANFGSRKPLNMLQVVGRIVEEADAAWRAVLDATSVEDLVRQLEFEKTESPPPGTKVRRGSFAGSSQ
ncbi:Rrf2 family transcriptional regulator (plasmid) [Rhizobium sp. BG4]|nr:Rrf2 family transcriptional regulator [Rhizobium sp. BG4]